MVRWQKQLYRQQPDLSKLTCAAKLIKASTKFLHGRSNGNLTNAAYPKLLSEVAGCLREGVELKGGAIGSPLFKSSNLAALEKEHRGYLLMLAR